MLFRNWTPFPGLSFPTASPDGQMSCVALLKASFEIVRDRPLKYSSQQAPLQFSDVYLGERGKSSLVCESDITPYKPATDIITNATAHASGGRGLREWHVVLQIGSLRKQLRVTGERHWYFTQRQGWQLSNPEICTHVELTYENAYGGSYTWERTISRYKPNPIGRGYVPPEIVNDIAHDGSIPAPRIESVSEPIRELSKQYMPEGLRAVGRSWSPRIERAGTYDQHWSETRSPMLPEDFDEAFFQCAHPSLILPGYLVGSEPVLLEGLDPDGPLRFSLPGLKFSVLTTSCTRISEQKPMQLDTLQIDVLNRRAILTWRARFRMDDRLKSVETLWSSA